MSFERCRRASVEFRPILVTVLILAAVLTLREDRSSRRFPFFHLLWSNQPLHCQETLSGWRFEPPLVDPPLAATVFLSAAGELRLVTNAESIVKEEMTPLEIFQLNSGIQLAIPLRLMATVFIVSAAWLVAFPLLRRSRRI